ncbi:guanylate kinase [candidate division KSB1 bacterium]|nr:guanylate kinase [candidate division KSB1 bacterium]
MNIDKGLIVVISSPSGGGKTTIIKELLKDKKYKFVYSISMTTRKKRNGEINGKDYWFVKKNDFQEKILNNELLEYEQIHGYYYGTPKKPLQDWLNKGNIVLMDLDVYGAFSVKKHFPDSSLLIFLKPPDLKSLEERLRNRSTETQDQINQRLMRVPEEMRLGEQFDKIVINKNISDTIHKTKQIIIERISFK